jgi:hypothetical protein
MVSNSFVGYSIRHSAGGSPNRPHVTDVTRHTRVKMQHWGFGFMIALKHSGILSVSVT